MNLNKEIQIRKFIEEQEVLRPKISLNNNFNFLDIKLVAGVDVSYWTDSKGLEYGICCIVIVDSVAKIIESGSRAAASLNAHQLPKS